MTKVIAFMNEPKVRHRIVDRLGWATMGTGVVVAALLAILAFTG